MKESSDKLYRQERKLKNMKRAPEARVQKKGNRAKPSVSTTWGSTRSSSRDRTRFPDLPSRSRTVQQTASNSVGSASSKSSSDLLLADSYSRSYSKTRLKTLRRSQSQKLGETDDANDTASNRSSNSSDANTSRNSSVRKSSTPKPNRTSSNGSLRKTKQKINSSPCLKSPPNKKVNTSKCISPIPSCFPLKSNTYVQLKDSDDEDISRAISTRLRSFEAKRQKLHLFKTRCFSDTQLILKRRVSDDFSDISDEDVSTINVFQTPKTTAVGADTIRFRSHIKYTCETFDKHMKDQYEGKIIDGKCMYSYWLFYQQVERFKAVGLEILEDALKSNDKQLLRDCIDEMKHEVKLIHNTFLNFDSIHRIEIENKRVMDAYAMMYERCGRFARLTRGGDIQPHEMIPMWDDIQQYIIDEFLEQVFIDFCFFMQLQFIIPQKEATTPSATVVKKGPDTNL